MADLNRMRCTWTGWSGAPGVTTFYSTGGTSSAGFTAAIVGFWQGLQSFLSDQVTITIPNSGDTIDDATGNLVGQWSEGTGATVHGQHVGNISVAQGVLLRWNTGAIHRGRLLRGRTFIVPSSVDAFTVSGVVNQTTIDGYQQAVNALAAGTPGIHIWGRPLKGQADGMSAKASSGTVSAKPCVLRSRRD